MQLNARQSHRRKRALALRASDGRCTFIAYLCLRRHDERPNVGVRYAAASTSHAQSATTQQDRTWPVRAAAKE